MDGGRNNGAKYTAGEYGEGEGEVVEGRGGGGGVALKSVKKGEEEGGGGGERCDGGEKRE